MNLGPRKVTSLVLNEIRFSDQRVGAAGGSEREVVMVGRDPIC